MNTKQQEPLPITLRVAESLQYAVVAGAMIRGNNPYYVRVAEIIERETGLKDLVEAAEEARTALHTIAAEETALSVQAQTAGNRALISLAAALARITGQGRSPRGGVD